MMKHPDYCTNLNPRFVKILYHQVRQVTFMNVYTNNILDEMKILPLKK